MEQYLPANLTLLKKVCDASHFILVCLVLYSQLQATHAAKLRGQFKNWTFMFLANIINTPSENRAVITQTLNLLTC